MQEPADDLTHELAHAWEAVNLADGDRDHYPEHRGLATWNDRVASWAERGIEDAAFMLQRNLMAGRVDDESDRWVPRTGAFEIPTGRSSPVLAGPRCGRVGAPHRAPGAA